MLQTPVLFLIFNRPDTTKIVFERIRDIQPARLYVAADAPRLHKPEEAEKCAETRAIINEVDWPCEVKTLFRQENLGCKKAVSEAISWFFTQEEQGIILEDDCLPDPTFFTFCEELLEKYKDDERIGHISGDCFLPNIVPAPFSYNFSSIPHIWGWATWRRVWKNVDINFTFWNQYPDLRSSLFFNKWEEIYFSTFISDALTNKNGLNPWGVFYYFSLRLQNQLSVYPSVNLVENIGLNDANSTHTKKNNKQFRLSEPIHFPLIHPYVMENKRITRKTIQTIFFSYKRLFRYYTGDF